MRRRERRRRERRGEGGGGALHIGPLLWRGPVAKEAEGGRQVPSSGPPSDSKSPVLVRQSSGLFVTLLLPGSQNKAELKVLWEAYRRTSHSSRLIPKDESRV